MENEQFEIKNGVLIRYSGDLKQVIIPEGVTEIGKNAFNNNRVIERVTLPDTVTKIGDCAFMDCRLLRRINIPDGVTTIGDKAFLRCKLLYELKVPASVTTIGAHAFGEYCTYKYDAHFPYEVYGRYEKFRLICPYGSAADIYAWEHHLVCFND